MTPLPIPKRLSLWFPVVLAPFHIADKGLPTLSVVFVCRDSHMALPLCASLPPPRPCTPLHCLLFRDPQQVTLLL